MTQNIVNLLVVAGLSLNEAVEMAEVENLVAESAYIDFSAEEVRDAEEIAFWARVEEEERAYYERNYKPFKEWVNANISGKSIEEIDPRTWDYYSDWHKDIYGFRPRYVPAKVEKSKNHLRFTVPNSALEGFYGYHDM